MVKKPTLKETIRLNRLRWFGHAQRMEENRNPKKYYIWIWKQQGWEVDQEIDGKMKWGRMEDQLMEKDGRNGYIAERNGRSSWERQGMVAFCTCQWKNECMNEWMNEWKVVLNIPVLSRVRLCRLLQTQHFLWCWFLALSGRWKRWAIRKRCHLCSRAQRFVLPPRRVRE